MTPVSIDLRPSGQLLMLLVAMHVMALVVVPVLSIDGHWQLGLGVAILVYGGYNFRAVLQNARLRLHLGRGGYCELEIIGVRETALLRDYSIVLGNLIVLRLEGDLKKHRLVLMPDSTDTESLRRLRVWLRTLA